MVRANELGCRNGWNADLWVPATTDDGVSQRVQPHDSIGGRAKAEVSPAEQNDLITSIVAAKTDNAAIPAEKSEPTAHPYSAIEEDIFVKQTPSLTWSNGPISSQPATALVQDPKAAILRARDQFRERRRTEGRLADRQIIPPAAPMLASEREAQFVDELDLSEPEPAPESIDPHFENRPLLRPAPVGEYESRRPVAPVTRREIERPFPSLTEFPEDRQRFESVPSVDRPADEPILQLEAADTWIETRQIDAIPPEPYVVDELFEEDEFAAAAEYLETERYEEVELSIRHRESTLNRYFRQRRERRKRESHNEPPPFGERHTERPVQIVAESWASSEASMVDDRFRQTLEFQPGKASMKSPAQSVEFRSRSLDERDSVWDREEPTQQPVAYRQRPASSRPVAPTVDFEDDFALPPPLPELDSRSAVVQDNAARPSRHVEPEATVSRMKAKGDRSNHPPADEFGDQPLFASSPYQAVQDYEIDRPLNAQPAQAMQSFRLERICQTCRDFRPTDNGERGWCSNKWAFNHRRMVDADDLACRNSLGSWWTPKDDVWRRDGDISRHAQQTPRVDQWLFGASSDENDPRRSSS